MAGRDQGGSLADLLGGSPSPGSASLPPGMLVGPKGYSAEDQARQTLKTPPVQDTTIPVAGRALLATIGGPGFESNGSYAQRYNQPDFTDFSKHPATFAKIERGPNRGLSSNAAGRYQMISTTWNDQAKKLDLKDFSPASQDKAAWSLAQETYGQATKGRNLAADLANPANLPQIAKVLKSQWSSLPGGVEQGGNMGAFAQSFLANLETERTREPGRGQPTQTAGLI